MHIIKRHVGDVLMVIVANGQAAKDGAAERKGNLSACLSLDNGETVCSEYFQISNLVNITERPQSESLTDEEISMVLRSRVSKAGFEPRVVQ